MAMAESPGNLRGQEVLLVGIDLEFAAARVSKGLTYQPTVYITVIEAKHCLK
jgi:hypothetical protein